ncbi:segregation and condensation protein A [Streptomyces sp. NPDC017086]|uniref:segregation and condensation protein A n=1 Tax=Streptomyces sp. NPDC017086 TaxID=3364976 RepID=UPI0037AF2B00
MTSYGAPAPGAAAGRRRALGRGPGTSPAGPAEPREPEEFREPEKPDEPGEPTAPEDRPVEPAVRPVEPEVRPVEPEVRPVEPAVRPAGARARRDGPERPGEPVEPGEAPEQASGPSSGPEPPEPSEPSEPPQGSSDGVFTVRLANFEGPFDLLLQLISRHKLDVTEVALSKVTDEFMAHIRAMGPDWDLDQTTEFLVVAATLLDLKAARLLPAAEVEDEADLALLEARDLLFARLLQYRAYKQVADIFGRRLDEEARRRPRTVGLEPHHAELLPEVVISIGPEGFARLAVKAMRPKPRPQVYLDHIHAPLVSVREQAAIVVARLRELGEASFRVLAGDAGDTLTVVARFLALLELYREKAVALEQEAALGELTVRWTGGDADPAPLVTDEFDRPPEPPKEEEKP